MTSAINLTAIDANVPAVDAELFSQPLRDNFAGIKTALTVAKTEIETLQSEVIDAQAAADAATLGFTPENSTNKDASGGFVGKTLEKINVWNTARTFLSFFVSAATAERTWTFPDKDGTVAMTSDLPAYNCKAFVNFDGTLSGTITPRASGNIASVVKNTTGVYTITMTNALADANYVVTGSIGGSAVLLTWRTYEDSLSRTSTVFKVIIYNPSSGAVVDVSQCNFAVFR